MKQAPIPENDEARLEALHDYELLAGSPESWFDDIASVANSLCQAPIALVSLVDRDRTLFKAASGLSPGVNCLSRAESFCAHAILEDGVFEVSDAIADERFHDNPQVTGDSRARFYAGAPLVNEAGYALGTIGVIDHEPRRLTDDQRAGLTSLARVVMQYLETRRRKTCGRHLERSVDPGDPIEGRGHEVAVSHDQAHAAFKSSPVGIAFIDNQRCIRQVNPALERLLGYDASEVIGCNASRFYADRAGFERVGTEIYPVVAAGGAHQITTDLQRSDGTIVTVSIEGQPIDSSAEEGNIWVLQDVTEQRGRERSLQTYQAVFESSRDAVIFTSENGRFIDVNPAAVALFEMPDRSTFIREFDTPDELSPTFQPDGQRSDDAAEALVRQAFEQGEVFFEWQHQTMTGRTFPAEVMLSRIDLDDRSILEAKMRDISERKATVEALREARDRAQAYFDAVPVLVKVVDVNGRVIDINPYGCELLGLPREEIIGTNWLDYFVSADETPRLRDALEALRAGDTQQNEYIENRIVAANGVERAIAFRNRLLRDSAGRIEGILASGTDITKLKEMEERQREARRVAEAANESKTAFLANVSHELRTPLNGIIGIAGILERNPDRPDSRDQLAALQESASGLLGLINDLLDLSQIQAGSMRINPHPLRLSRHLRKLDHLLRPEAERKRIGLILEMEPGMPDGLHGDGMRMCQIMINLLNNAIKFTETGSVRLSAEASSVSSDTVQVVLTVSDTGPGMPASVQEHIFEPFSQADSSVVRQYGGAGLGLAICRRLVGLMEGSIRLDSEVGKGTTFTVTLPFAVASQAEMAALEADTEPSTAPSLAVHDYRVLLVEDGEINRHVATAMLDELGLHTVGCESGQAALDAFRAGAFDLVLLDIQMPDMSGYEVVEAMRAMEAERGDRTPILAVTAHSENVASLDARSEAFDALLRKPLTFQGLQDAIKGWLTVPDDGASGSGIDSSRHSVTEPAPTAGEDSALIDEALVMSNLSGDVRLVHTLMDLFERQHSYYLDLVDTAVQSGDSVSLADAAHKLKGAVGYFNQSGLWQEVAELERVAGGGERDVTDRIEHIRERVFALADEVRRFSLST